jgi:endonuclease G
MSAAMTDAQRQALIRRAIAKAETAAGKDDRTFLHLLRFHYFSEMPTAPTPTRRGLVRAAAAAPARPPAIRSGAHIYEDPRYLANARELARRAKRRMRVIGGTNVKGSEFDDCVAVGDDAQWGCTGTLIAANAVLTAGHCLRLHTRIFVGNDVAKKGREIRVADHVRHPKYHKGQRNDLMLLILAEPVKGVKPRPLASSAAIDAAIDGRVVGFGAMEASGTFGYGTKRQTDVPIASIACSGKVNGEADAQVYGCDRGLEFVAGKPVLGQDTCSGDSGGPFYIAGPKGAWQLAGATSRATDLAGNPCGDGGVYVRVDQYRDWITSVLKGA